VLDARLCISYHTIENRGPVPRDLRHKFGDWIFGCDECLDSCPVGRQDHETHPDFAPQSLEDARPALAPLLSMDEESFRDRFQGRAIMRARRDGFVRNVCVALGNVGTANDLPALFAALDDPAALVRGHAAWAAAEVARRHPAARTLVAAQLTSHAESESDAAAREELAAALARLG
jgi:epoxyqueuosine reductase